MLTIDSWLRYGAIGLGLALAFLTFRLLAAEQKRPTIRRGFLSSIYAFLWFSILLFAGGVCLEWMKNTASGDSASLLSLTDANKALTTEKIDLKKENDKLKEQNGVLEKKNDKLESDTKIIESQLKPSLEKNLKYEDTIKTLTKNLADFHAFDPFKSPNEIIEKLPKDVQKHSLELTVQAVDEIVEKFNTQLDEARAIKEKLNSFQKFENDFLYRILVFHRKAGEFGDTLNFVQPAHEDKIWLAKEFMTFLGEIGFYDGNDDLTPQLARSWLVIYQKKKGFGNPSGFYGKDVLRLMIADYYSQNPIGLQPAKEPQLIPSQTE